MATHVTLLHNPQAGFNPVDKGVLLQALEQQGYAVNYVEAKKDDIEQGLTAPADLVVIAGGDGTVRKVASCLLKKRVPIAVLPLGTANNIATSMGISGDPADIIARLDINRRKAFDIGLMKSNEAEIHFLESAGFGLIPRLIREHSKDKSGSKSREEELEQAKAHLVEMIRQHKATSCSLHIDGRQYSGDFLMVQFMNTKLTGPGVMFAPSADPGDGMFQVVLIRENDRENFVQFVENGPINSSKADFPLIINGRNITVAWEGWRYHADDETYEAGPPVKAEVSMLRHALEVLY
ncbi:diacylglycerol kinase family protein [Cesiribacter sp. SM1]|uniref:diacylglycerol/lipid kinase family protein n=1 Tax=Cesiribacter sp. SM1 TaxID=2861196 RepID=UPI001CD346F6|nr:diacylglycerol kinase family protein [Cesiribacter sp. SM1]